MLARRGLCPQVECLQERSRHSPLSLWPGRTPGRQRCYPDSHRSGNAAAACFQVSLLRTAVPKVTICNSVCPGKTRDSQLTHAMSVIVQSQPLCIGVRCATSTSACTATDVRRPAKHWLVALGCLVASLHFHQGPVNCCGTNHAVPGFSSCHLQVHS